MSWDVLVYFFVRGFVGWEAEHGKIDSALLASAPSLHLLMSLPFVVTNKSLFSHWCKSVFSLVQGRKGNGMSLCALSWTHLLHDRQGKDDTRRCFMFLFCLICRYLFLEKFSEEDRNRTHIFSSFFYKRLTQRESRSSLGPDEQKLTWVCCFVFDEGSVRLFLPNTLFTLLLMARW